MINSLKNIPTKMNTLLALDLTNTLKSLLTDHVLLVQLTNWVARKCSC